MSLLHSELKGILKRCVFRYIPIRYATLITLLKTLVYFSLNALCFKSNLRRILTYHFQHIVYKIGTLCSNMWKLFLKSLAQHHLISNPI